MIDTKLTLTILWVLIFTLFDYYGFVYLDKRRGTKFYRILQGTFQLIITYVAFILGGWQTALASNIIWITLGCDVLFYIADDTALEPFTWFKFSPVNYYYQVIKKQPTPVKKIIQSSIIGVFIALNIIIFL